MNRILTIDGVNPAGLKTPTVKDRKLWNRMMEDVQRTNAWCPDVTRIIFQTGERTVGDHTEPTLATTMFFSDNTKVTCINSIHDKITMVKDPATGVMTASDVDKERGIVYCTVKKLVGEYEEGNKNLKTSGFGNILRELVAMGHDPNVDRVKAEMQTQANRVKHEEIHRQAVARKAAKPKQMTLEDVVAALKELTNAIASKPQAASEKAMEAPVETKKVTPKKLAAKKQARNSKGQSTK